jgi:hypothetical protein
MHYMYVKRKDELKLILAKNLKIGDLLPSLENLNFESNLNIKFEKVIEILEYQKIEEAINIRTFNYNLVINDILSSSHHKGTFGNLGKLVFQTSSIVSQNTPQNLLNFA